MTQDFTNDERELQTKMSDSSQLPATPNVELGRLTRDQEEYVEKIRRSVTDFDRSAVVGGPRQIRSVGE